MGFVRQAPHAGAPTSISREEGQVEHHNLSRTWLALQRPTGRAANGATPSTEKQSHAVHQRRAQRAAWIPLTGVRNAPETETAARLTPWERRTSFIAIARAAPTAAIGRHANDGLPLIRVGAARLPKQGCSQALGAHLSHIDGGGLSITYPYEEPTRTHGEAVEKGRSREGKEISQRTYPVQIDQDLLS